MNKSELMGRLRKRRARLLNAYVLHVGLFASSCAFAATDTVHLAMTTSLWLALLTIPPVLYYTVLVHRSCRSVDPRARTAGVLQVIVFTVLLTPYESSLVLPLKNLWISRRILRAGPSEAVRVRTTPPDMGVDKAY
jgi:hypothetical protein